MPSEVPDAAEENQEEKMPRPHHVPVKWHEVVDDHDVRATQATLQDKASIICRSGLLMLSGGTGAWRIRDCMNRVAAVIDATCVADIGLVSIECTVIAGGKSFTQVVSLPTTGVNTHRIALMESYVREIEKPGTSLTVGDFHARLDAIEGVKGLYSPVQVGLASALACAAFVFLLGGGAAEMACAFVGAGVGNWLRRIMLDRHINAFTSIATGVAAACIAYLGSLSLLGLIVPDVLSHEAGYIGAMLFVIPGFPLITSGLDIAKLDMRSGLERLAYALSVILVATLVGWLVATVVQLTPDDFVDLGIPLAARMALNLLMSFFGVFGFSIMFNSPTKMATTAGLIGAVANTLRLELVSLVAMPPEAAAFLGALSAGLLASAIGRRLSFPRISLTVPSIVIMVPGLYMYRAVFCMAIFDTDGFMGWITRAALIVVFLPIGLALARVLTDKRWRYCN